MYRCVKSFKTNKGMMFYYGNKIVEPIWRSLKESEQKNFIKEEVPQEKKSDDEYDRFRFTSDATPISFASDFTPDSTPDFTPDSSSDFQGYDEQGID
jgi:hypothetical protein